MVMQMMARRRKRERRRRRRRAKRSQKLRMRTMAKKGISSTALSPSGQRMRTTPTKRLRSDLS